MHGPLGVRETILSPTACVVSAMFTDAPKAARRRGGAYRISCPRRSCEGGPRAAGSLRFPAKEPVKIQDFASSCRQPAADATMALVDKFHTKMYQTNVGFVVTVTRDDVRNGRTPISIFAG
jgi:hypothetical protein